VNRFLTELPAPEAAELIGPDSIVIQPLGAIEQHGPHLPLNTDFVLGEACVCAGMAAHGDALDLWALPPLAYTRSVEHVWQPGTVALSTTTLLAVLEDIGAAVARLRAKRLVLFNAHGGNTSMLNAACRDLRLHHGLMTFLVHPMLPPDHGGVDTTEGEFGLGIHGGHMETSMMLHLRPDLVRMNKAQRHVPEALSRNKHVGFGGSVSFGWLSNDFGPSGVIGDPTKASSADGEQAMREITASLGEQLAEVKTFDFANYQA
jgi:creatinine amidohydrolase